MNPMAVPPALSALQHMAQAMALHQAGERVQARAAYQEVLERQPAHAAAAQMLGLLELQDSEDAQALHWFLQALHVGRSAELLNHLGCALKNLGRLREALACFEEALSLQPQQAQIHCNRGIALHKLGRPAQALKAYDRAIALQPTSCEPRLNRAITLEDMGRHDEALQAYDGIIAQSPQSPLLRVYRGMTLQQNGRWHEAIAQYDQTIALWPDAGEAHYAKAYALLALGDWERGWPMYEWRWRSREGRTLRPFAQPMWTGEQPLAGKTILLHNDQGLGDGIMLSRLAAVVAQRGARVILEVQPALVPLMRALAGPSEVLATEAPAPPFDWHCPLFSLPAALRLRPDAIPSPGPYLRADPRRQARWAERLGPRQGVLRVGIAWSGNPRHSNDLRRSMSLAHWLEALPPGCEFVSLQREVRPADRRALRSAQPPVRHFGRWLRDFSETAALCEQMDLVISVDTSVAHLAAALGKPTWILLPLAPDFRWLLEREDSPWYGCVRLFRQGKDRDWAPVLARVRQALGELASARGVRRSPQ